MSDRENRQNPLLHVSDLVVSYGKIAAIKGISFDVYKGEIVAMLGANGAGKTTTLNALTSVISVKNGEIVFKGKNIKGMPTHKITIMGMIHVPEGRRIFPSLTVGENLRAAAYLYEKKDKALFENRRDYVMNLFPRLRERVTQLGGTLSGGEQQMLAIGRALITGGDIVLMDEPSMGMAPNLVMEIFETIKKIAENGQTIMLVEQNAMMAMEIAHYCYVLETGNVTYDGTPQMMKANKNIVEAYLGS
ncbi:ABC transporter ATP-binding protein [Flexilinea flocculi]|uniref:Urea ABC transporter ATP-binding protein n=1 Tax=Flexilinea flocculi TaxID=1678840 RepID=A0A0S7BM16_9CHLR|nr:ABC transporter ATP-binding protein [Flexilinea flocculi]GAP41477.1 urea ABC transporter ATP-binding protein [Flexilinea flocculi]